MAMLRKAFQMFDTTKSGYIEVMKISTILNTMGQLFDDSELQALISENDPEGKMTPIIPNIFNRDKTKNSSLNIYKILNLGI